MTATPAGTTPSRPTRVPPTGPVSRIRSAVSARTATVARLIRYSAVSLVSTTTSLVTLAVLVGLIGAPAIGSNILATAVGTVPSFELNRRWVWKTPGRRSLLGQIVPFCALSFTGLVVSTLAVGVVSGRTSGWSGPGRTVAVLAANVTAYGALWIVQYQMLDRFLFRSSGPPSGGTGELVDRSPDPCRCRRAVEPGRDGGPRRLVEAAGGSGRD